MPTGKGRHWLALTAAAAVDLGYRLATAPAAALRAPGLHALRQVVVQLARSADPDVEGPGPVRLCEQFQAQVLSALRAAAGGKPVTP